MTVTEAITLIGALTAAIVAIMGAAVSLYTAFQAAKTHTLVNGMSTAAQVSSRIAGQAEGRLAQAMGTDTPLAAPPPGQIGA